MSTLYTSPLPRSLSGWEINENSHSFNYVSYIYFLYFFFHPLFCSFVWTMTNYLHALCLFCLVYFSFGYGYENHYLPINLARSGKFNQKLTRCVCF